MSTRVMAERTNLPGGAASGGHSTGSGRKRSHNSHHHEAAVAPKLTRVERDFARGAIRRLRLHNFLTFDDADIHPSPQLNVIVGPNGTGKSSIVCAMCLGLGGQTRLLGRAREIREFIKHGKDSGYVEIELHENRGRGRHPIIRRYMKASNNSSVWTINGKEVHEKEVKQLVQDMRIQLDNKCQFLPQDIVVEFARMNLYQLLEETEKAIGPADMYDNHKKLKEMKGTHRDLRRLLHSKEEELQSQQRKNHLRAGDVKRFRVFQQCQKDIKHLRMKKAWVEYELTREKYTTWRGTRKEAERRFSEVKQQHQPIKEKHAQQMKAVEELKQDEQQKAKLVRQSQGRIETKLHGLTAMEDELEAPRQELEAKEKEEAERREKINTCTREIQGFETALEKLEPQESLNPKLQKRNARMRQIQQKVSEVSAEQQSIAMDRQQHEDQIRRSEDELRQMQDVRNQRLMAIKRMDGHTYRAILWLRENRHRFKQDILEPIMLIMNLKDQRYSSQVEAFFGGKDSLSFVALNEEDKETFLVEVRDRQNLKVNIVRAPAHRLDRYKPDIPFHVLQRYGFQRMLIELIDAPEAILCYFCQFHGLHHVPVAGELVPDQITRIIHELKELRRFYTGTSSHFVKRSRYMNKSSVTNSDLYPPRILSASVDLERKTELETAMQAARRSLEALNTVYNDLSAKSTTLRQEDELLRQEKNDLRKILDSHRKLQSNIRSRKTQLELFQASSFDLKAEEEQCEQAVERIQRKRIRCVGALQELLKESVTILTGKARAGKCCRAAQLRADFFWSKFRQAKAALDSAEQRVNELREEEQRTKDAAQRLLAEAKRVSGVNSPQDSRELMAAFQSYPGDLDTLETKILEYQAQADLSKGEDMDSVITEFEERVRTIRQLETEISDLQKQNENHEATVEQLKQSWLTPLKELLEGVSEKFSEFFTEMRCVGQVKLLENEDFSKFGAQIMVKFRDSEDLQALNGQRQSGGERSVSTMLYLMALQEETSCPFRVVDEINQGMDPVNERRVFDLIVKTASKGAQYFLLTPKLLQNLTYSQVVQVHVVHNGQELMPYSRWNMAKFLE